MIKPQDSLHERASLEIVWVALDLSYFHLIWALSTKDGVLAIKLVAQLVRPLEGLINVSTDMSRKLTTLLRFKHL